MTDPAPHPIPSAPTTLGLVFSRGRRRRLVLWVFVANSFLAALLLFAVQPMVARMLLPRLGGSPAAWGAALVFFQLALLAGYGWANLVARRTPRCRTAAQLALVAAAVILLPVGLPEGWRPPAGVRPELWTMGLLTLVVGLPFLALSTTSPTLQRWFSATDHRRAQDPYFLYAAGNAGSLLGLALYPALIERRLGLVVQARWWAAGYVAFFALTVWCAWLAHRHPAPVLVAPSPDVPDGLLRRPSLLDRLRWASLAAIPSGLLLAVTRHISTDIAAVALLWVIPLGLYLATFVAAFAPRDPRPLARGASAAFAVAVVPTAVSLTGTVLLLEQLVVLHLAAFTAAALAGHARLAQSRPAPAHLTTFYVWLAAGGAAGGLLTAIVAPVVFDRVWEYPLLLAVAAAAFAAPALGFRAVPALAVAAGAAAVVSVRVFQGWTHRSVALTVGLAVGVAWLTLAGGARRRRAHGAVLAAAALTLSGVGGRVLTDRELGAGLRAAWLAPHGPADLDTRRTFFGVYRVAAAAGERHRLVSGTTTHGEQWMADEAARREPRSYYHRATPIGQWFEANEAGGPRRVAVVGLGAGTIAAWGRPGDAVDFYEIDAEVEDIARDERLFTYLADATVPVEVVVGDARLMLEASDRRYDLIVLDAFGSDAIPIHLLTQEAIEVYLDRLTADGVVAVHTSSRTFDLAPPLARIAEHLGLSGLHQSHSPTAAERDDGAYASAWVLLARDADDLASVEARPGWRPLAEERRGPRWTDDFVDLLGAFRWSGLR